MRNKIKCLGLIISLLACALVGEGREHSLDLRESSTTAKKTLLSLSGGEQAEVGKLRTTRLKAGAAKVSALAVGDKIKLRLYDDVELGLKLVEREISEFSGKTFQAVVEGEKGLRNAIVTEGETGLMVNVTTKGKVYSIVSTDEAVIVNEKDPHAASAACAGVMVPQIPQDESKAEEGKVGKNEVAKHSVMAIEQASTIVDVLVAYDATSAIWANRNGGGITNYAQQAVAKMNVALGNNSISSLFRFRLVGVIAVEAEGDGNFETTLEAAQQKKRGWEAIAAMRDEVGADVVTVMIDTGSAYGTTGLGYSLAETQLERIPLFADWAYNVVSVRAVEISHTMTHEVGHNMGAGHADTQKSSPGPQSFPYSSGYYFVGASEEHFHTVMAYSDDGYGNRAEEAPLFSSAIAKWDEVVAGDAERHNNEQVLRNNYQLVSQFRAQKVPMSYDVFFSPESGSLFSSPISVTLTPGKPGNTIRYTTDGSTPTETHGTIYNSPILVSGLTVIKAVVITDNIAGPVYTATYYPSDISTALGVPEFVWKNSDDEHPWIAQGEVTYDGELAVVSSALTKGEWGSTSLSTVRTGAETKMSFRYKAMMYASEFSVLIDDNPVWTEPNRVDEWKLAEVDIPAGRHEIAFRYSQGGYYYDPTFCGVWIDDIRFDALSRTPTMMAPCDFNSAITIKIDSAVPGGKIFYTLDGTNPEGANAILYTKPFVLKKSTVVRVIEVDPNKDASIEIGGLFRERHPIEPGEWTEDVEGVKKAAAENGGKLICVVEVNNTPGSTSEAFCKVAYSLNFRKWAKANGVYLLIADRASGVEYDSVSSYFNTLHNSTDSYYFTQMYFALPNNFNNKCTSGIGTRGNYIYNNVYVGTIDSLIQCFGGILTALGYDLESYTPPAAAEILETKGIVWENDPNIPWREESPSQLRIGGRMSDTYSSTLRARVMGPGKFIYSYKFNTWTSQNTFTFPVNGLQETRAYNGELGEYQGGTITNVVNSKGETIFEWQYKVEDSARDYNYLYQSEAGVWLYDVKWLPKKEPVVIILK